MKTTSSFLFAFFCAVAPPLHADELTRDVQKSLKELGFYYGEVTGVNSPETAAAVKRFQIRNGYEVTGSLTKETLQGLDLSNDSAPVTAPPAVTSSRPAPAPVAPPPIAPPRDASSAETDRRFLQQPAPPPQPFSNDPSAVPPPITVIPPPNPGTEAYADLFQRTPYEGAPSEVQISILRKAQTYLARRGYLSGGRVSGQPNPDTEEALLAFQRRVRLPMTGRLDMVTLDTMQLLPGRSNGPALKPFTAPSGSSRGTRIYRGVWVD